MSLTGIHQAIDRWFLQPEPNAAANSGLFRILYALFYIWQIHDYIPGIVHDVPPEFHGHMLLTLWLPTSPPVIAMNILAGSLIAGLVLLLFGYQTRFATALVLVSGLLFESFFSNVDIERGTIFLTAFVPFFMLAAGDWGATYSIDAALRRRAGFAPTDPRDTSPRFVLPVHASLVLLAILFCQSGILKVIRYPIGFGQDHYMAHLFLKSRIGAAVDGAMGVPFANLLYDHPSLDMAARWIVIAFEITFPLALANARLRSFYVATALLFHSVNAIWLDVTFTCLMVVYGLFIDWHSLLARVRWKRPALVSIPPRALALGVFVAAGAAASLWLQTRVLQGAISLGYRVDTRTIWFPVLPIAAVWTVYAAWLVIRGFFSRARVA